VIALLSSSISFPDPETAGPDGLLALGGDLSVARLVAAYTRGIFPWYDDEHPILWWSPDPRPILAPRRLQLGGRFRRTLAAMPFQVEADRDFQAVISACAVARRPGQSGTWLTQDMIRAFVAMHLAGYAHSVECRLDGELVGGIYGVALGRGFFGESMFHTRSHASKVAFVHLVWHLADLGFLFLDCQQPTPHVMRFGAVEVPRRYFTALAGRAARMPAQRDEWITPGWWSDRDAVKERIRAG